MTASGAGRGGPPAVMLVCDYSLTYFGGAQTAFIRQARALADQGWAVVVVAPGADEVFAPAPPGLVAVAPQVRYTMPRLDLPILGRRDELVRTLGELVGRHAIEGIVVHSEFSLAAAALEIGQERAIPVLHTVHTFFWRAPAALSILAPGVNRFHSRLTGLGRRVEATGSTPINNALRSMTLRVARRADIVLSPSVHQAKALRAAGAASTRTLSNVSEPVLAAPRPDARGPLTLLWAARFAPEKRLDVALDAMRIVRERIGPGRAHLHVAGGEHRPHHDVTFHGRVPTERVSELIELSDAVLITSVGFDNQPMIALEAFTRARPASVSDPVLREEFDGAAVGTPEPTAAGLAATIVDAVADRSLLAAAGERAAEYARARGPARHAAELATALADAANGPRPRAAGSADAAGDAQARRSSPTLS